VIGIKMRNMIPAIWKKWPFSVSFEARAKRGKARV
jgi:hypothetical protein